MKHLSTAKKKAIVCLLFLATLLLGFLTAADYGRPWDEPDETSILRMNLWEYTRALGLDESLFIQWADGNDDPLIARLTPISESVEQDHGVAAFYPLAGAVMDPSLTGHSRMILWHLWCWALFTLGLYALYACCRELGLPRWAAGTAALCLLLSPRFFAEGHYNNKDVALLSLALCMLWQGLRLMKKPTFLRAALFALAGALAANTKVAGLALWAVIGLTVLLRQAARKTWNRRTLGVGLVTLSCFVVFYILLTPASWKDPAGFFGYLVKNAVAFGRWENYVRFRGVTFFLAKERLPWYYLPYMMLATTPVWLTLLAAGGQAGAALRVLKNRRELGARDDLLGLLLCSALWLLPLGFALLTRTTVYNGWRHFYFLGGFPLILAAWGLSALAERWKGKPVLRRGLGGAMALCLLCSAVGIVRWHPYQYAYYQPLVRLATQEDDLELDYWNVSVMNGLNALAKERQGMLTVGYADLWAEEGLRRTLPAMEPAVRERIVITDERPAYVLVNPTYALYSGFEPKAGWREAVRLVSYGRTLMTLYQTADGEGDAP